MRRAILLHGTCSKEEYFSNKYPSLSNSHWFPWLQKELLMNGVFTQTPEMPEAYNPQYKLWKDEFEKAGVDKDTILVGHSCGGGFLIRWLSENKVRGEKLILVAPWIDPDREKTTDFFDFEIDSKIVKRFNDIHLFISDDDDNDILVSVDIIKKELQGIKLHNYKSMGHFTYEGMNSHKFPDLLKVILNKSKDE